MGYIIGSDGAIDGCITLPFGKYATQPVEVLRHDLDYARWLLDQEFYRTRYAALARLTADIVKQEERRIAAHARDKAETAAERAAEAMLLVNAKADIGLCSAFAMLQAWLDDANAGPLIRLDWLQALIAVANTISDDKRLLRAYKLAEPALRSIRDFPALVAAQLAMMARAETGAAVIDIDSRRASTAAPAPKKRA
jgi:hypothetical protein